MAGGVGVGDVAGRPESSPSSTEPSGGLVIRAARAHQEVAADPDLFRPVAEALVAEARQARQPEALALALRALALAEQSRLHDSAAIVLLLVAIRKAPAARGTAYLIPEPAAIASSPAALPS